MAQQKRQNGNPNSLKKEYEKDGAFIGRMIEYLSNPAALKKNFVVIVTLI